MTEVVLYGASCFLFLSLLICIILSLKKLLSYRITASAHYYIWFVPLAALTASFFPKIPSVFNASAAGRAVFGSAASQASDLQHNAYALQDLFVNTRSLISQPAAVVLFTIWISGTVLMLIRILYGIYAIHRFYKNASPAAALMQSDTLHGCRTLLHINRFVEIRTSEDLQSPAAMGIFRPCILLPADFKEAHIPHILLHELVHCKHQDALLNLVMQLFLAFNWHNPLVWYAVKQMECDRELCCDSFVLKILDKQGQTAYGRTLIDCAADRAFPAVGIKQTVAPLYRRISQIASFDAPKASCKRISWVILAVMVLAASVLAPSASALTDRSFKPEKNRKIRYENLKPYFEGSDGCFVLYDLNQDSYTVYNKEAAFTRVSPDSTYKIYSSLLALESGFQEASYQKWDGTIYSLEAWNQNQNLHTAMSRSVNWYFQALDEKSGKRQLQEFYDFIGYGNCDLSGGLSRYWMESSLKISPMEQVMLLADFYENKWEFKGKTITALKAALQISGGLFGKTGTGMVDGKTINGWFVGYTEAPSGPQFFALNLRGKDGASGSRAADIARHILSDKGLL